MCCPLHAGLRPHRSLSLSKMLKGDVDEYAIFRFASEGQRGLLSAALKQEGVDVNAKDADGRTLLHGAASNGHLEIVELLLSAKAEVNTHDEEGWTPLISAASAGKLGVVRRLGQAGADVSAVTSRGCSALTYACSKGHTDLVAFLLEQNSPVNSADQQGDVPLHRAARHGDIVQLLLAHKNVVVSRRNKVGKTPLHIAAEEGEEKSCRLLLEAGCDADALDVDKQTPRTLGGSALEGVWPRK